MGAVYAGGRSGGPIPACFQQSIFLLTRIVACCSMALRQRWRASKGADMTTRTAEAVAAAAVVALAGSGVVVMVLCGGGR